MMEISQKDFEEKNLYFQTKAITFDSIAFSNTNDTSGNPETSTMDGQIKGRYFSLIVDCTPIDLIQRRLDAI